MTLVAAPDPIFEVLARERAWHVEPTPLQDLLRGLPHLPDQSIDHVLTDPPFGAHAHAGTMRTNRRASAAAARRNGNGHGNSITASAVTPDFIHLSSRLRTVVARELVRTVRRWIVLFSDEEGGHAWRTALIQAGARWIRWGTWVKVGPMPQVTGDRPGQGTEAILIAHGSAERLRWNGGGRPATFTYGLAGKTEARLHPTQKPIELLLDLVRSFTDRGDLVIDPFAGSGTTGEACIRLGRRCLLWESKRTYARIATRRLSGTIQQLELEDGDRPCFDPPPAPLQPEQRSLLDALSSGDDDPKKKKA